MEKENRAAAGSAGKPALVQVRSGKIRAVNNLPEISTPFAFARTTCF